MGESWVVGGPQVIEVEQVTSLRVALVGGRVDVVGRDEPGARIEVHSVSGRPLEVDLDGGELKVGYSYTLAGWEAFVDKFRTFSGRDHAEVHIAVPHAVAAKVGTVSADGLLAGVDGDAAVSTVSGQLVTDHLRGALQVNTVSGEVAVRAHDGDLRCNSVSGHLTATGDLRRVHANTVSGSVVLDLDRPGSSVSVSTVSGDVTARLADGSGMRVEVRTASGHVVVGGVQHRPRNPGSVVSVDLPGEGAGLLSATTVSGDVVLVHGGA